MLTAFVVFSLDTFIYLGIGILAVVALGYMGLSKVWPEPQYSPLGDVIADLKNGYKLGNITDDHLQNLRWYIGLTKQERDDLLGEGARLLAIRYNRT